VKYCRFDSFSFTKFDSHDAGDEPGTSTTDRSGMEERTSAEETETRSRGTGAASLRLVQKVSRSATHSCCMTLAFASCPIATYLLGLPAVD
jgi:hypothetical protein